eukprot:g48212.t1
MDDGEMRLGGRCQMHSNQAKCHFCTCALEDSSSKNMWVLWAFVATACAALLCVQLTSLLAARKLARNVEQFVKDAPKLRSRCLLAGKRALVFVNPHGGSNSAYNIYRDVLLPMSKSLGVELDLVLTQYQGHCKEVTQNLAKDAEEARKKYAVVVCISGDGMLHEAINGLSLPLSPPAKQKHEEKERGSADKLGAREGGFLLALPVSILPAGSSNGVATSMTSATPFQATKSLLLGRPSLVDLYSVQTFDVENGKRRGTPLYDIHITSYGIVADHNYLAEVPLRWMGKALKGVIVPAIVILQAYRVKCRLLFRSAPVSKQDKAEGHYREVVPAQPTSTMAGRAANIPQPDFAATPPPVEPHPAFPEKRGQWWEDQLLKQGGALQLLCAANLAWGSHDTCFAPGMLPDSGFFDVMIIRNGGRLDLLKTFVKMETAQHIYDTWLERYKLDSMVLIPTPDASGRLGRIDVSGERFPSDPVVIDLLPSAALFWHEPPGNIKPGYVTD